MTVKELIRELQNVPEDAIVAYHPETADKPYIVDGVNYNDATNAISFYGGDIFEFKDEETNIPDSADKTNYNPYMESNDYEEANHIFEHMIHWCNYKGYSWKIVNKHFFWQTNYQTGEKDENYNVKWHRKEYFTRI